MLTYCPAGQPGAGVKDAEPMGPTPEGIGVSVAVTVDPVASEQAPDPG